MLPGFKVGDELTAAALNALEAAITDAEHRGQKGKRQRVSMARVDEDDRVYPWQVELSGDTALVRGGRIIAGYGTDTAKNPLLTGDQARVLEPFGTGWVEVPLPQGGDVACTVWLVVEGHVSATRHTLPTFPRVRYWGETVHAPAVAARLVASTGAPEGDSILRAFPLAQVVPGDEDGVTQLLWGDIDVCGMWGVADEWGGVIRPKEGLPRVWGEACTSRLCAMEYRTDSEEVHGSLSACLDEMGGLELYIGRLPKFREPGPKDPDDPGFDPVLPVEPQEPTIGPIPPPNTPPKKPKVTDPDGWWYEGGKGIKVTAKRDRKASFLRYDFEVSGTAELVATAELYYNVQLDVSTKNSTGRYDWPGWASNLQMYYGVTGDAAFTVSWRSSFMGADNLPKNATVKRSMPAVQGSCAPLIQGGFATDSETAPTGLGNIILVQRLGTVTKRQRVWHVDPMSGKRSLVTHERKFRRVRLALNERKLVEIAQDKIIQNAPLVVVATPPQVSGQCSNIDPPVVTLDGARVELAMQPAQGLEVTGPLEVSWGLEYAASVDIVSVTGSGSWNQGAEHGSINEQFRVELPESEMYVDV